MTKPEDLWRDLCEKDDRTSPEEYPDMALVTQDELVSLLQQYGDERAAAAIEEAARLADDRCVPLEDVAAIRALAANPGVLMSDVAPLTLKVSAKDASHGLDLLAHKVRELETEVVKLKRRIAAADKARRKVAAAAREAAIEEAAQLCKRHAAGAIGSMTEARIMANFLADAIRALAAKPGVF